MAFTVDHSRTNELKPAGKYEVIVDKVVERYTKNNTPYLNFTFTIRNDVENPVKGGKLFGALYKKKQPTAADLAVDGYSMAQVQTWCKAAKFANGRNFENLAQVCEALVGALVIVQVKHEEYNGKMYERVDSLPEPTNHPDCKHQSKPTAAQQDTLPQGIKPDANGYAELADDDSDVPF